MILYSTKEIDEALVLKREFYYCLQASYTHTTGFDADAFLILAEDVNKQFPDNTRESFSPLNGFHMGCYKLPRWCSCTVMAPGVTHAVTQSTNVKAIKTVSQLPTGQ